MAVTMNTRTTAEIAFLELLDHFGQAACGDDIPGVDQTVEMASRFLDLFTHVIFTVEVEDIGDKVESMLIVVYFRVKACQVEAIGEVFFVYLAEILVSSGGYKLDR